MAFQKGHPKFGGRKKNSVSLLMKCEEARVDVFTELIRLAQDEEDPDKRFNKMERLASYLYAKPKEEMDISRFTPEQIREYIVGLVDEPKSSS